MFDLEPLLVFGSSYDSDLVLVTAQLKLQHLHVVTRTAIVTGSLITCYAVCMVAEHPSEFTA